MSGDAQLRFGKFTLLHRIATGGMGEVHLAKLRGPSGFEKLVVIKRLLETRKSTPHYIDMFFSEARVAAQLGHSNIVQIYEVGQIDGVHYIAMEYIQGKSFRQILDTAHAQRGFFPAPYTLDVIAELCAGLSFAHNASHLSGASMGLIHRDVNPHNVLISYQGEVKIIDFGIAKSELTLEQTQAGTIKGTVVYMSPEQANGKRLDKRSDIFSVGICLYEALVGDNPFYKASITASLEAIRQSDYEPLEQGRPELLAFAPIVSRALQRDPTERYADCSEMAAQLLALRDQNVLPRPPQRLATYLQNLFLNDKAEEERLLSRTELVELSQSGTLEVATALPAALGDGDATQVRGSLTPRLEITVPGRASAQSSSPQIGQEGPLEESTQPGGTEPADVITQDRQTAPPLTAAPRPTQPTPPPWPLFVQRALVDILAVEGRLQSWAQRALPRGHAHWQRLQPQLQAMAQQLLDVLLASRRAQGLALGATVVVGLGLLWLFMPSTPPFAGGGAGAGVASRTFDDGSQAPPTAPGGERGAPSAGSSEAEQLPVGPVDSPTGTNGADGANDGRRPPTRPLRRSRAAAPGEGVALSAELEPPVQWALNGVPVAPHAKPVLHGSRGQLQIGSGTDAQSDPFAIRIRYAYEGRALTYSLEASPWANVFGAGGVSLGRTPLHKLVGDSSIHLELRNPRQQRSQRLDLDFQEPRSP